MEIFCFITYLPPLELLRGVELEPEDFELLPDDDLLLEPEEDLELELGRLTLEELLFGFETVAGTETVLERETDDCLTVPVDLVVPELLIPDVPLFGVEM